MREPLAWSTSPIFPTTHPSATGQPVRRNEFLWETTCSSPYPGGIEAVNPGSRSAPVDYDEKNDERQQATHRSFPILEGLQRLAPGRAAHPGITTKKGSVRPRRGRRDRPPTDCCDPFGVGRLCGVFRVPAVFAALDRRLMALIPSGYAKQSPTGDASIIPYPGGITAISPGARSAPGVYDEKNDERQQATHRSFPIPEGLQRLAPGRAAHPGITTKKGSVRPRRGRRDRPPTDCCDPFGVGRLCGVFGVPAVFAALDRRLISSIPSGYAKRAPTADCSIST